MKRNGKKILTAKSLMISMQFICYVHCTVCSQSENRENGENMYSYGHVTDTKQIRRCLIEGEQHPANVCEFLSLEMTLHEDVLIAVFSFDILFVFSFSDSRSLKYCYLFSSLLLLLLLFFSPIVW